MLGRALHAGLQGRCAAVLKKAQHTPRFPREAGCRLLSSADLETREYIEQWQHAQVRDQEWYEQQALERRYFFHVDLQGRLFLEETEPKNIATCLKQDKFLAFFFKRVRRNDLGWGIGDDVAESDRALEDYPFVSKCGDEMNFIRPADQAIVFEDLRDATEEEKERMIRKKSQQAGGDAETKSAEAAPTHVLAYGGGTLSVPFDPTLLRMSERTGRLYHGSDATGCPGFGLVRSQLAVRMFQDIAFNEAGDFVMEWEGKECSIGELPHEWHNDKGLQ